MWNTLYIASIRRGCFKSFKLCKQRILHSQQKGIIERHFSSIQYVSIELIPPPPPNRLAHGGPGNNIKSQNPASCSNSTFLDRKFVSRVQKYKTDNPNYSFIKSPIFTQ